MTSEGGPVAEAAEAPRRQPPRIGRGTPTDWFLIGTILVTALWHFPSKWLASLWVKEHLLLLLAIRPSIVATIAAGHQVQLGNLQLWIALFLPLPVFFLEDPFYFWAGRRYGQRFVAMLIERDPSWEGRIARVERIMKRHGALTILFANIPVQPIPTSMIYFVAGTTRMRLVTFVVFDLIGLEMWTAAEVWLGYRLGDAAEAFVNVITDYSNYILWGTFALITWVMIRSAFRGVLEAQGKTPAEWRAERRSSKLTHSLTTATPTSMRPHRGSSATHRSPLRRNAAFCA